MAQQPITQDIVIEDVLKAMTLVEGAVQYLVLNSQGIPIKKSPSITAERALHLSFLLMDYWSTTKKVIQSDLKMSDVPLKTIPEHCVEDKNQNYQAKIDYHNPIIQQAICQEQTEKPLYIWFKIANVKKNKCPNKRNKHQNNDRISEKTIYSIIFNILTFQQYPRRLNSKHMDKQYSRVSKIYYQQSPYRSTSDLIPKCRAQALKAKRAAARIKINLIAKQLYELKYDHEWQQEQLRRLVNKGECIMKEVDLKIKKVQQEVIQLNCSAYPTMEELHIQKIKFKEESLIASERSTQPQVQSDSVSHNKALSMLYSQRLPSKKVQLRNNGILRSAVFSKQKMLTSSQHKKLAVLKANSSKQASIKSSFRQIPFLNIFTFVSLVVVVLFLL